MSRMLSAQDAVMALLPLVDSPPWVRDGPGGKVGVAHPYSTLALRVGYRLVLDGGAPVAPSQGNQGRVERVS
jgi:hypothetical protein